LGAHAIFNYILRLLYLGCQWKELPIDKDHHGRPAIHYTRIYRAFQRWEADGCLDAIFEGSVLRLRQDARLDTRIIHGDGTTSAAKKGGDNLGFSGHKKVKGCKVVAFCERNCNVIAPIVSAPGVERIKCVSTSRINLSLRVGAVEIAPWHLRIMPGPSVHFAPLGRSRAVDSAKCFATNSQSAR
jgi:transposase